MRGRRIYYENETGNVILAIGELKGFYRDTTIEQEVVFYAVLSERNRDTFDVLELEFGQHAQDFAESNGYRVNPKTKKLEFNYPDPNKPEVEQPYQAPLSEVVAGLKAENEILTEYMLDVDFRLIMIELGL